MDGMHWLGTADHFAGLWGFLLRTAVFCLQEWGAAHVFNGVIVSVCFGFAITSWQHHWPCFDDHQQICSRLWHCLMHACFVTYCAESCNGGTSLMWAPFRLELTLVHCFEQPSNVLPSDVVLYNEEDYPHDVMRALQLRSSLWAPVCCRSCDCISL